MLQGLKIWGGGRVTTYNVGAKNLGGGANRKGGAKIWGAYASPPSDMPVCTVVSFPLERIKSWRDPIDCGF